MTLPDDQSPESDGYDFESNNRITMPPPAPTPDVSPTEPAKSWESVIAESLASTLASCEAMRRDFFNWVDANSKKQNANWAQLSQDIRTINRRLQEGEERFGRIEQMISDHDERDRKMVDRIATLALKPHELSGTQPLQGMTILILEDDELLRGTMEWVCRQAGASVLAHSTAEEAAHSLNDPSVNVATVDMLLGTADGMPFVRNMRAHHRDVAVLIVTGRITQDQAIESRALNCSVLQKPFTPDELVNAIIRARDSQK